MRWREERGQSAIFFALAIVVLMGFAAISFDVGRLYIVRFHAQNAADAAALAGVQHLPTDVSGAISTAIAYAGNNGFTIDDSDVQVSPDNLKIRVVVPTVVRNDFAELIGYPTSNVDAVSIAQTGALSSTQKCELNKGNNCPGSGSSTSSGSSGGSNPTINTPNGPSYYGGVMPWGVQENIIPQADGGTCVLSDCPPLNMVKSGDSYTGNFYAVRIDGSGANTYSEDIANGSTNAIWSGEVIPTETGKMVGPTGGSPQGGGLKGLFNNCAAAMQTSTCSSVTVLVPIIATTVYQGETQVTIIGLAAYQFSQSVTQTSPNEDAIYGTFVTAWVPQGNTQVKLTPQNFGLYSSGSLTNVWP